MIYCISSMDGITIDVNGIVKSMVKDREEKENNVVSIDDRKEE